MADLQKTIDIAFNGTDGGLTELINRLADNFDRLKTQGNASLDQLSQSAEKTAEATAKFQPVNLGDVDFVAEGMKRLGDATWLVKRYQSDYNAEMERVTLPDGMVKVTDALGNTRIQMDYARKSAEGYWDTLKDGAGNVLDHIWIPAQTKAGDAVKGTASEMEKARKAAEDYALKLLDIESKAKVAGIEAWGKIDVAQIEAQTKQIESLFKSIDNTVSTTGKSITDLWGQFGKLDSSWDKSQLLDSIKEQEKLQQDSVAKQNALLDEQIRLIKLKADQMAKGDALIKVEAPGLKTHLEYIFGEILKETQVKASEQGLNLLLGFSS